MAEQDALLTQFDGLQSIMDINKVLDDAAHNQGLVYSTMDPSLRVQGAISSGLLSFDLMIGGGFAPGRMSSIVGPTGAGKSTFLFHTIKEALGRNTLIVANDHESSFDPTYLQNIGIDLDKVCGFRNKKGTWEVTPQLRYAIGTTAESTFRFMNVILKNLPDKIQLWDDKEQTYRYFLISNEFAYKPTWRHINDGLKKKLVVEVETFAPQVLFVTDSLKAMLPEARDEDPNKEPIAALARVFAANLPLVKAYIGRKNCGWLVTNHLTINPMAQFQNPETEPGGSAVQFYPDFKMRVEAKRTQAKMQVESTVQGGGEDRYFIGTAKITKNKFGPSFRSMEYRMWLDSAGTPGMGIDPVFDTYMFLKHCDLMKENGNSFKILLEGHEGDLSWQKFKKLILIQEEGQKIREACFKLISSGKAQELYYEYLKNNPDTKKGKKASAVVGGLEDEPVTELEI